MKELAIAFLQEQVLGKYMKKYRTSYAYPVITGGTGVSRCTDNISVSDIDIVFAITETNPSKQLVEKVSQERYAFLKEIMEDESFKVFTKGHRLTLKETYKVHPEYRVSRIKLVRLKLDNDVILDTSVKHSNNVRIWDVYPLYINKPDLKNPIPYFTKNGVFYCTCQYALFDTLRLILFYEYHRNVPQLKKYIFKYASLAKLKVSKSAEVKDLLAILRSNPKFVKSEKKLRLLLPNFYMESIKDQNSSDNV